MYIHTCVYVTLVVITIECLQLMIERHDRSDTSRPSPSSPRNTVTTIVTSDHDVQQTTSSTTSSTTTTTDTIVSPVEETTDAQHMYNGTYSSILLAN